MATSILSTEGSSEPEGGGRDRGDPSGWFSEGARPPPSAAPQTPPVPALLRPEGGPHLPACRFHQAALSLQLFSLSPFTIFAHLEGLVLIGVISPLTTQPN